MSDDGNNDEHVVYIDRTEKIIKWLVKAGDSVRRGETIAYIGTDDGVGDDSSRSSNYSRRDKLCAPSDGFITLKRVVDEKAGCVVVDRRIVATIEACSHPAVLGKLCAVCGMSVDAMNKQSSSSSSSSAEGCRIRDGSSERVGDSSQALTISGGVTLSISADEAKKLAHRDRERLHTLKKLSLVLDLDHTLLHATGDPRAAKFLPNNGLCNEGERKDIRTLLLDATSSMVAPSRGGVIPRRAHQYTRHFIKIRPNLKTFFDQISELYEVQIYTAGTRDYAFKVSDLLSRYMVGAKDEEEMMSLRENIKLLENKLASMEKDHDKKENNPEEPHKNVEGNLSTEQKATNNEENSNARPRKRVKFSDECLSSKGDTLRMQLRGKREILVEAEKLEASARILRQQLFGSRIISRTDVGDLGRDVKDLKRAFPCGGVMSAVVDDREDVWANAKENISGRAGEPPLNLLLVKPYHCKSFTDAGYADVNNVSGSDLSRSDVSLPEEDEQLLWTADILTRLHKSYYAYHKMESTKSVPDILGEMRRNVLRDRPTNILLSGIVPIHGKMKGRPPVLRYAEELGAKVFTECMPEVTHLVCNREGTLKFNWAMKKPKCVVVRTAWLMKCLWSLKRISEDSFMFRVPENPTTESENTDASSDDDFEAELEKQMFG